MLVQKQKIHQQKAHYLGYLKLEGQGRAMKSISGHVVEMVLLGQGGMAAPWCRILKLSIRAFVSFKLKGTVKKKWGYI